MCLPFTASLWDKCLLPFYKGETEAERLSAFAQVEAQLMIAEGPTLWPVFPAGSSISSRAGARATRGFLGCRGCSLKPVFS